MPELDPSVGDNTVARSTMLALLGSVLAEMVLLIGVWLAAANVAGWQGWSAIVVVIVLALVGARSLGRPLTDPTRPLGDSVVIRAAAALAVSVSFSDFARPLSDSRPVGETVAIICAVVLAAGGPVLELSIRRLCLVPVPFVARLPGVVPPAPLPGLAALSYVASLMAISLGAVIAALRLSPWWWLGLAAISLVPAGLLIWAGRNRLLAGRRLAASLPAAIAEYAPEFVVYTARPDDASYQVTMWLPYLQRAGRRFIIITRDEVPAQALAALTDAPIVVCKRVADLDAVMAPSLRAAFYVNASSGNGAFVRYHQLTHVYLGHGDSDKPPSYNPTHAMYDRIFAAGPAAARRYGDHGVQIPADKFEIVGRPQVEDVQPASRALADVESPVVLYAPTWRGHVEETMLHSLPMGETLVAALIARGSTVIFRPHPFSYQFESDASAIGRIQKLLSEDARASGRAHLWGAAAESERGILDCINDSDAMVSDVSSVVSDYLFSGKPFAMVAVPVEPAQFVLDYPIARAAYVLDGQLTNLEPVLAELLGADPAGERRAQIRVDYLGDFPADGYADAFIDAVHRVLDDGAENSLELDEAEEGNGSAVSPLKSIRRELSVIGQRALATGAAVLSLGAVLAGLPVWVPALLALGSLTVMMVGWRGDLVGGGLNRLLGAFDTARALAIIACGLAWVRGGTVSGPVLIAGALLLSSLVAETGIRSGWGRLGLEARSLPGLRADVSEVVPRGLITVTGAVAVALGWLLILVGAPSGSWLVVAGLQALIVADALVRATTRAYRVVVSEQRLRQTLVEYAPEFVAYFSSTIGAAYQLGMWLPYFRRIDRRFIIVVRSVPMLTELAELTDVPIIHRPTLRSLEDVIVPSMTTAFYVNNAVRNTHFVERRDLTHVWLNHGDSEKPACYNPVHGIYDRIFVAGQAGIDRYARHGVEIQAEKFDIVGRPQVEQITASDRPIGEVATPTVLYAPTWQGPYADSRVYSLPQGAKIVQALLDRGVRVIFRAHPFNYRFSESVDMMSQIVRLLEADRATTGRDHVWGKAAERDLSVEECFNLSDAMISDVSAVVTDYLQSDKPFAMVAVGRTPEELVAVAPAARAGYLLAEDLTNLDSVLDDLLRNDPLASVRDETRIYYLGDFRRDQYADGFVGAARSLISTGRVPTVSENPAPAETVHHG